MLPTHNNTLRDRPEVCGHHSSDTHLVFGVDVSLGFGQFDSNIGMPFDSSHGQRRVPSLQANNGILRDRRASLIWAVLLRNPPVQSARQNYLNLHHNIGIFLLTDLFLSSSGLMPEANSLLTS